MTAGARRPPSAPFLAIQIEAAAEAALARGNVLRAARLWLLADEALAGGPGAPAARNALAVAGVWPVEDSGA